MNNNDYNGERSSTLRPWVYYPSSSTQIPTNPPNYYKQQGPWKATTTPFNAISFGFVATALLISLFLIMAILEHLFRSHPNHASSSSSSSSSSRDGNGLNSGSVTKSINHPVITRNERDLSVVMPGQKYPTCIAHPTPLLPSPSPREPFHH